MYPAYSNQIDDYSRLDRRLFRIMSFQEYLILTDVLIRFDLVRRRLPNPGVTISSRENVGENGVVAFTGGHDKKMSIDEIMRMVEGAILEINALPPRTAFWPSYSDLSSDRLSNPYRMVGGLPADVVELAKMGTLIRCLIAMGILEVDISFNTSESGLQLTWDRSEKIKGWRSELLNEYKEFRTLVKWNHANHAGVGVGTVPWASVGIWGTLMNNVSAGGQLALNSLLGFTSRGNVPL